MEMVNQQSVSTNPLTTVSPRRVNTDIISSNRSSQTESDDAAQRRQIEQAVSQQNASIVQQLKSRDREVRAHEAAHAAVGGQYVTGGPSFTYQKGPDGRSYAIGGEVRIDTSKVPNDPEATQTKAEIVRRAALAPAQPSPQDLRVAARSSQTAAQARVEIAALRAEEAEQALQQRIEVLEQSSEDSGVEAENNAGTENEAANKANEFSNSVINTTAIQSFESEEARTVMFSLFA